MNEQLEALSATTHEHLLTLVSDGCLVLVQMSNVIGGVELGCSQNWARGQNTIIRVVSIENHKTFNVHCASFPRKSSNISIEIQKSIVRCSIVQGGKGDVTEARIRSYLSHSVLCSLDSRQ